MPKLRDIKDRINQLDGGAFQNLCDEYLTRKGYGVAYSLGMKTGSNKTAKGNPDTYFRDPKTKKYVFVMYTTQQGNIINKALQDFEKCFNSIDTGIREEDICEIIFCYTSGRLRPGDNQRLHDFCEERNTKLT